ncbi:hypothetical protein DFJ69_5025 [Thermomonospora umbrina]|uniref:Uncharacterized protein n=1 Tax=Thermomonospora umbrina TaxID=111806 RepID=A0A3D9SU80_9ACTN|nr:hypothetical protein DFJ69_5025 [Thermomonospora umbrina]
MRRTDGPERIGRHNPGTHQNQSRISGHAESGHRSPRAHSTGTAGPGGAGGVPEPGTHRYPGVNRRLLPVDLSAGETCRRATSRPNPSANPVGVWKKESTLSSHAVHSLPRRAKLAGAAIAGTLALTPLLVLATATPAEAPTGGAVSEIVKQAQTTTWHEHRHTGPHAAGTAGPRGPHR